MTKNTLLILLILSICFLLRLYKLNSPLADWHSWRQSDTSAVSRLYLQNGIDLLHPKYNDLSSIPSGLDNPLGYRFVEFPIYNAAHALLAKVSPLSFEATGRLLSAILSTISAYILFLISFRLYGYLVGILSALFYSALPFSVYYGRVILPEPLLVLFGLLAVYFLIAAIMQIKFRYISYLLGGIFLSLAILIKPFIAVYLLPILYLSLVTFRLSAKRYLPLVVTVILALIPFGIWRWWMGHYPSGIPASTWLFNSDHIRFKGAFFYWLFAERIAHLILGYWGTVFLSLGLIIKSDKLYRHFSLFWLLGGLTYLFVVATGNVRHDYYQVMIIPILCLALARGLVYLLHRNAGLSFIGSVTLAVSIFIFSLAFSWYQVRGFYQINRPEIVTAGNRVDLLTPKNAKVIAPYGGDTAFLYQTNRLGWPVIVSTIDQLIDKGATIYVSVIHDQQTKDLMAKFQVIENTKDYVIINLLTQK